MDKIMDNNLVSQLLAELLGDAVLVWGYGREGRSSESFLRRFAPEIKVAVTDAKRVESERFLDQNSAVSDNWSAIFKSPGISRYVPPAKEVSEKLDQRNQQFWSNTRLCFELVSRLSELDSRFENLTTIGVTGTKGKSTTTAVIHHLLTQLGHEAFLGGNIGVPPLSLLDEIIDKSINNMISTQPFLVLELSSHQLLDVTVSPNISVVQMLAPEHLDYYPSLEEYYQAKHKIVAFQNTTDLVFFNHDNSEATELVQDTVSKKIGFGLQNPEVAWLRSVSPLLGDHNVYNVLPGVLVAERLGHSVEEIKKALKTFKPLPHRLEPVTEIDGVLYVNDSLSTTPAATEAALAAFQDRSIILIAGGYERHQEYSSLAETINRGNVKAVFGLPSTGQRLLRDVRQKKSEKNTTLVEVKNLEEAVRQAQSIAQPNDVVLLSPGAASFDQFTDYAERGERFREVLESLKTSTQPT